VWEKEYGEMGKENGKIREKKRVKREKGGGKDKGV